MLVFAWVILVVVLYPPGKPAGDAGTLLEEQRRELGSPSRGEKVVATVFTLTALAWLLREPKDLGAITLSRALKPSFHLLPRHSAAPGGTVSRV